LDLSKHVITNTLSGISFIDNVSSSFQRGFRLLSALDFACNDPSDNTK
jgi:hypothetical protein